MYIKMVVFLGKVTETTFGCTLVCVFHGEQIDTR